MERLLACLIVLVTLGSTGSKAWATIPPASPTSEETPDCSRPAASLPDSQKPPGTPNVTIPLEHILVLMEENHSFDNFLGRLNAATYRDDEVDGVKPEMTNPDKDGKLYHAFHQQTYCVSDTNHSWDGSHLAWNNGANDGFVEQNSGGKHGARALGYYEEPDLRYLYAMASRFAIGDRYFSSVMGPTYPNRSFLYAASAYGHVRNNFKVPGTTPLIFDVMSANGVSWKYYVTDLSIARQMLQLNDESKKHFASMKQYRKDLAEGALPSVAFLETSEIFGEEHPPFDFQHGQRETAELINELVKSRYWPTSAFLLMYDEHGGYYDHVAPPRACEPDEIAPILGSKDKFNARFDRYGFRVPFVAISPFAKRHFVSHVSYDHTSVLKLIETKFNLPALSRRDANASAMLDLFNFRLPPQLDFPTLPLPKPDLSKCLDKDAK